MLATIGKERHVERFPLRIRVASESERPEFTFHVVALPHTQTRPSHNACAYTMKVLHFAEMMHSLGHKVYHYGAENSIVGHCAEDVPIISAAQQHEAFGEWDPNRFYGLDWTGKAPYWKAFNDRAIAEIGRRKQPRDFLALIAGSLSQPLAAAHPDLCAVEYGIGYSGVFSNYRVFESYAHMHRIYGQVAQQNGDVDGRCYDCVIPNYYDPEDFAFSTEKDDYFLYLGRLIKRKGVTIAVQTAAAVGAKLIMAGQGAVSVERGKVVAEDGEVYSGDIEHVGHVNIARRSALMSRARAVFVPTLYVEPFGGVAVEAQLCGTPVITTDWGAFTETVLHGETGYRCRTLDQFVWAAENVHRLDPWRIRQWAVGNYSMDRIKWRYQEYFQMLSDLWGKGWPTVHGDRTRMDWLRMYH